MKKIIATTVLWGAKFCDIFTTYCLPSLLDPGNLPQFGRLGRPEFWFVTDAASIAHLERTAAFRLLRDHCDVRYFVIPDEQVCAALADDDTKGALMCAGHKHAISMAEELDAGLVFIIPDNIFPANSFTWVVDCIEQGKRAVLAPLLAVTIDSFGDDLRARWAGTEAMDGWKGGRLSIEHDLMIDLCLAHEHPLHAMHRLESPCFSPHPSMLYWPLGQAGFIFRGWHPMPTFVHPRMYRHFSASIDNDFIVRALASPDFTDCAFAHTSRQHLQIEVAPLNKLTWDASPRGADPYKIACWALTRSMTNAFSRHALKQKYWIYKGEYDPGWESIAGVSDRFVDQILRHIDRIELGLDPLVEPPVIKPGPRD